MSKISHCYILSDGRPGHMNQSKGLLQLLGNSAKGTQSPDLSPRIKWLKRPIRAILPLICQSTFLLNLLYRTYYGNMPPTKKNDYKLLISTGGDTLLASIILSHLWQTPNIFIGKQTALNDTMVSLLVTTTEGTAKPNILRLSLGPTSHTPHQTTSGASSNRLLAVLIGGNTREYQYTKADYTQLAAALNQICEKGGWRLLLTTSRRTGMIAEDTLKTHLKPQHLADVTWYGEHPRPTAGLYSSQANIILCSEDSGSMLRESLNYGKPALAFSPPSKNLTPFYKNLLEKLGNHNMQFSNISELANVQLDTLPNVQAADYSSLIATLQQIIQNQ